MEENKDEKLVYNKNNNLKSSEENKIFIKELVKTVIIVSLVVVFVRFFIMQPFVVLGRSMEPNFHDNEYLFVDELTYHFRAPERGEVVVFRHPENACTSFINEGYINRVFLQGPCSNYIKRVIGLPGETIIINNGVITIKNDQYPDGFTINESYIPKDLKLLGTETITLNKDNFFVLGDNRNPNASSDSREWGPLPKTHIIGKAWLRVVPFNKFGFINTPSYQE